MPAPSTSPGTRLRVLLVSSSGGVFRDLLALRPWWSRHEPLWAVVRAPDTEAALEGMTAWWVAERRGSRPWGALAGALEAGRVLREARPDVVLSSGSGVATGFFVAARAMGVRSYWLETFNLVRTAGLTGRICGRLATEVLLQRPGMRVAWPRGIVLGELY